MRLLRVLMFVDWHTARLRPLDLSLDALVTQVMLSRSTVAKAPRRLQELGMLNRRESRGQAGKRTYVYVVLPPSQWVGYRDKDRPPSS
jgi:predicted transcriptional regulator